MLCVKTHYPERAGHLRYKANRAVLLVRNPFDAILYVVLLRL